MVIGNSGLVGFGVFCNLVCMILMFFSLPFFTSILFMYSRVTKVLASWLNFIVQLASSQPPLMVLKAKIQSQETEPSNFYPSPLIEAEEDIQSGIFETFLSHHLV